MNGPANPLEAAPPMKVPEKLASPPPEVKPVEVRIGPQEQGTINRIAQDGDPDKVLQDIARSEQPFGFGQQKVETPPTQNNETVIAQPGNKSEAVRQANTAEEAKVSDDPYADPEIRAIQESITTQTNLDPQVMNALKSQDSRYSELWYRNNARISMQKWNEFIDANPDKAKAYAARFEPIKQALEGRERLRQLREQQQRTEQVQNVNLQEQARNTEGGQASELQPPNSDQTETEEPQEKALPEWAQKKAELDSLSIIQQELDKREGSLFKGLDLSQLQLSDQMQAGIPMVASVIAHRHNPEIPIAHPTLEDVHKMKPWVRLVSGGIRKFSENYAARFDSFVEQRGVKTVEDMGTKIADFAEVMERTQNPQEQFMQELTALYQGVAGSDNPKDYLAAIFHRLEYFRAGEKRFQPGASPDYKDIEKYKGSDPSFYNYAKWSNSINMENYPLLVNTVRAFNLSSEGILDETKLVATPEIMQGIESFLRSKGATEIKAAPAPSSNLWRSMAETFAADKLEQGGQRARAELPRILGAVQSMLPENGPEFAQKIYGLAENVTILKQQGKSDAEIVSALLARGPEQKPTDNVAQVTENVAATTTTLDKQPVQEATVQPSIEPKPENQQTNKEEMMKEAEELRKEIEARRLAGVASPKLEQERETILKHLNQPEAVPNTPEKQYIDDSLSVEGNIYKLQKEQGIDLPGDLSFDEMQAVLGKVRDIGLTDQDIKSVINEVVSSTLQAREDQEAATGQQTSEEPNEFMDLSQEDYADLITRYDELINNLREQGNEDQISELTDSLPIGALLSGVFPLKNRESIEQAQAAYLQVKQQLDDFVSSQSQANAIAQTS